MGLLDDAIREHLELRRAHGADPTDVERQEREALGALRQEAEFASPSGDDEAPAAVAAEAAEPQAPEAEPDPELEAQEAEEAWFEEGPDEVPRGEALEHPPTAAEDQEGEDVLEETPEFLQETPEHDRLWFEQRPPRDFDWDK
jgi:hypothetical protein